jgi:HPt (histidine-containing phosphotransfer) domain-containing protein
MGEAGYDVVVERDLWVLIPKFLENQRIALGALRTALSEKDVDQLRRLGHRIKGAAASYGFHRISALGKDIEDSVKAGRIGGIAHILDAFQDYLAKVRVSAA